MARTGKNTLLKNKLLIGEGKDEQNFLNALLKHLGIADIQVEEYGGKNKLSQYLAEFGKRPGRSKVRAIGITRDVDKSLTQDFQSVCQILTSFQFSVPANPGDIAPGKLAIGVFMFPDNARAGILEDLCLAAAQGDPSLACVDEFFQCVSDKTVRKPVPQAKARLHAWLSSQERPDLRLGEAAFRDWWPWDHAAFEPLRQFLRSL